jgi:hypothetical protein
LKLPINGISIFSGAFYTYEDQNGPKYDAGTTWQYRWGFSFSLDTAKAWLK